MAAGAPTALADAARSRPRPACRPPARARAGSRSRASSSVLALVGAFLLRERGIRGTSSASALTGADPFIAVVPALVGIAAGIVAVRLLPIPMLLLSRLAAIRRDLVPVLALRRVTRGGTSGPVLVVLMATATIGAFSGGDARPSRPGGRGGRLGGGRRAVPGHADPGRCRSPSTRRPCPGVTAAAGQFEVSSVVATRFLPLQLVAIDTADFERVVEGTPGEALFPDEMVRPDRSSRSRPSSRAS